MSDWAGVLSDARVVVLLTGFAYAAVADLRTREVSDRLWQLLGLLGLALGAALFAPEGSVPLILWVLVGVLTLEHLVPWDELLPPSWGNQADRMELVAYAAVTAIVGIAVGKYGLGDSAVPVAVIAVLATVLLSRALFELGALYGGADAKALMIAGLLLPLFPHPLLASTAVLTMALSAIPYSISLLTNAALLSLAVPLYLGILNLRRGEFSFPRGFTGFSLPVADLPGRFVWVRDPAVETDPTAEEVETSAEDEQLRRTTARKLKERGIARVWVSPQLPFLVLMALGALAAILAGNLILDLIALF